MSSEPTPGDVRRWDASAIEQVFHVVKNRDGTYQNFGDTLDSVQQQLSDWGGEAGDAFHQELNHKRQHIDSQGRIAPGIVAAVDQAETDVNACRAELAAISEAAAKYDWQIPDGTWMVDYVHNPNDPDRVLHPLEQRLAALRVKAATADHELAQAMRAAVGDVELDSQGHEMPPTPGQPTNGPNTVPGPHDGDPKYKTGLTPTLAGSSGDQPPMQVAKGSSDTVTLQDNPPGYSGPAGPARDAAWQAYLSQQSGAAKGGVTPALVLPNPDAVSDPGLKTVGAAAKQQGVSYAWGGGHLKDTGVSKGWAQPGDRSEEYNDGNRTGFDCAGLARFATSEGRGFDISAGNSGNTVGQEAALTAPGGHGATIPDSALKPGDLIYYGAPGDSEHVVVYAGNGLVVQAHQSGEPVEVSPIDLGWEHRSVHVGN